MWQRYAQCRRTGAASSILEQLRKQGTTTGEVEQQDLLALFHAFRDNLKALRDAKVMEVIEGSTEIHKITIPRLAFSEL